MYGKEPPIVDLEREFSPYEHMVAELEEHWSDARLCLEFLVLRKHGWGRYEIAERHFQVVGETLKRWTREWEKNGLMEAAREAVSRNFISDIFDAEVDMLAEWPAILKRQIKTAKGTETSPRTALMAAAWLHQEIVKPAKEAVKAPGSEEQRFLEANKDRPYGSPMIITPPDPKKLSDGGG